MHLVGGRLRNCKSRASRTLGTAQVPTQVEYLEVTPGIGQITLTWQATANALSYRIYRAVGTEDFGADAIASIDHHPDIPNYLYIDRSFANGVVIYRYQVVAVNAAGNAGPPSLAVQITLQQQIPELTARSGNARVTLRWAAVPGATSYRVYRAERAETFGAAPVYSINVDPEARDYRYDDTLLTNNVTYRYRVVAITNNIETHSGMVHAVPRLSVPGVPNLSVSAGNAEVTLTWSAVTGATSYNLYHAESEQGLVSATAVSLSPTTFSYTHSRLTNGSTYYYQVAAVSSAGEGTRSTAQHAVPRLSVPGGPDLSVSAGNAEVTLSWGCCTRRNLLQYLPRRVRAGTCERDRRLALIHHPLLHSQRIDQRQHLLLSVGGGQQRCRRPA